ncbi:MAG: trypsin-like peptidase domain-containing protein, partial [Rhizobiales bacterium]|nr:trypsin-like peptidase domain-containing protein [Hyphomicrobiales bacterium]
MNKSVFQSQLEDDECVAALREVVDARSTEAPIRMGKTAEAVRTDDLAKGIRSLQTGRVDLEMPSRAEAIVMRHNYPSLLILDGTYEEPENPHWKRVLDPHQPAIQRSIASVGRVDLTGHRDYTWVGTLWRIADDILITNRHVASIFAKAKRDGGYRIQKRLKVFADFKEEHRSTEQLEFLVKSIVSIEPTSSIDMALLRLDGGARDLPGEPVPLRPGRSADEYLAVVGYPAWDHRNDAGDMARIFRDIFNVKRLAPGKVMNENHSADVFTHNCTTLGGNSGSLVLDIESGGAVGLHFAGSALSQNYAVKAEAIEEAMRRNSVTGYRIVDGSRTDG